MADKLIPPRTDFKAAPVFVKATIADQAGHRPGYVRQWFHAKDALNRGYYEKYTQEQFIGDKEVGYCKAAAWTPVPRSDAKAGRPREDDGKGIETALTHGDLVCLETTDENFRVYQEYDRLRDVAQARKLSGGDDEAIRDESGRPVARYRARVGDGSLFEDHKQLLNEGR
jgi:hypothetical protein